MMYLYIYIISYMYINCKHVYVYIYIFVPIVTFKIQLQLEDLRLQMGNHLTLGSPIREAPNPGAAKWRVTPHPFGAFADGI